MELILTTLPHLFAINWNDNIYSMIIITSTSLSILYHLEHEKNINITNIDYVVAGILALYEITIDKKSILLNIILLFINLSIPYNNNYPLYHSIWHLLSACKTIYMSSLLASNEQDTNTLNP
jgi:hypothetical protein